MQKIVFFGSSPFSCVVLEKIAPYCVAVVTNPDRPAGRGLKLTENPVKTLAKKNNIPVFETINDYRMTMNDAEQMTGIVAAYGQIIKQEVLDKFNGQIYNIHPSLLPKYRGAAPLQQQILDGVVETGVTIIKMDDKMDHGPIVAVAHDTIRPDDTAVTLGNRLFATGADLILNNELRSMNYEEQNHAEATYTKKLTKQDGFIPWDLTSNIQDLRTKQRAFTPWPGTWTIDSEGKRIKLS